MKNKLTVNLSLEDTQYVGSAITILINKLKLRFSDETIMVLISNETVKGVIDLINEYD